MKKRKKWFFKQINTALTLLYCYNAMSCQSYWNSNKVKGIVKWWRALWHQSYISYSIKFTSECMDITEAGMRHFVWWICNCSYGWKKPQTVGWEHQNVLFTCQISVENCILEYLLALQNICSVSGRAIQMWFYTNGTHLEVSLCRAVS